MDFFAIFQIMVITVFQNKNLYIEIQYYIVYNFSGVPIPAPYPVAVPKPVAVPVAHPVPVVAKTIVSSHW